MTTDRESVERHFKGRYTKKQLIHPLMRDRLREDLGIVRALLTRAETAEKELDTIKEAISDPTALCVNIIRGSIVKPDVRSLLHLHGAAALEKWDSIEALEAQLAAAIARAEKAEGKLAAAKSQLRLGKRRLGLTRNQRIY